MGAGTGDIVVGQTPIELGGFGQASEFGGGSGAEAAAPQGKMLFGCVVFGHSAYLTRKAPVGEP